jgi:hypothetical protein
MNGEELETPKAKLPTDKWPEGKTVGDLMQEITRARTKFPGNRYLLAALVEEVGELAEALVSGTKGEVYKEAIQCACVAIRIAEEGDATTYTPGFFIALVSSVGRVARGLLQRGGVAVYLSVAASTASKMKETPDPTFADVTDEEAKP